MRNIGTSLARWEVDRRHGEHYTSGSKLMQSFEHVLPMALYILQNEVNFQQRERITMYYPQRQLQRMLPGLFCSTCKAELTLATS